MNERGDRPNQNPDDGEDLRPEAASSSGALNAQAEELAKLQAERDALTETLVRRQADFENYRKRIERERKDESRRAQSRLIEDLLPVLDGFERALSAHDDPAYEEYRKGLEIIYKQLWDTLARHGLERIDAAGKPFDPHIHLAIDRVETRDHPDGTVVEVLQQGYRIHDRVLRPSGVRVAVHPAEDVPGGRLHSAKKAN
ncbi:MAG: nucleotide exchange factor GrpE [Candidatus Acidiferrales bacterium]